MTWRSQVVWTASNKPPLGGLRYPRREDSGWTTRLDEARLFATAEACAGWCAGREVIGEWRPPVRVLAPVGVPVEAVPHVEIVVTGPRPFMVPLTDTALGAELTQPPSWVAVSRRPPWHGAASASPGRTAYASVADEAKATEDLTLARRFHTFHEALTWCYEVGLMGGDGAWWRFVPKQLEPATLSFVRETSLDDAEPLPPCPKCGRRASVVQREGRFLAGCRYITCAVLPAAASTEELAVALWKNRVRQYLDRRPAGRPVTDVTGAALHGELPDCPACRMAAGYRLLDRGVTAGCLNEACHVPRQGGRTAAVAGEAWRAWVARYARDEAFKDGEQVVRHGGFLPVVRCEGCEREACVGCGGCHACEAAS